MVKDTRPLWEEIFSEDSASFLDYYYRVKIRDNWIQTDVQEGEIRSMIHWNPYPLWVRGTRVESRYLIAVATRPGYRHQGRMARLLREGLQHYADQDMPFVWLMPADPAIYEPFDFRYIYDKIEGKWPAPEDGAGDNGREDPLTVRILTSGEYPQAASFLQEELAARYDVFTERTAAYLAVLEEETSSEDGHLMGIFDREQLIGVFSYWLGEKVEIRELVVRPAYESGRENVRLLQAVSRYFASLGLPVTAITTGWLGSPKPIIMARLVSLKAFMLLIQASEPLELCLEVRDPLLPENNGIFCWRPAVGDRPALWRRAGEGAVPGLSLSIAELAGWLLGEARSDYPQIRPLTNTFFNEIV